MKVTHDSQECKHKIVITNENESIICIYGIFLSVHHLTVQCCPLMTGFTCLEHNRVLPGIRKILLSYRIHVFHSQVVEAWSRESLHTDL